MAIITWGPTLETGIKIIDEQHKVLVDLINQLHDAMTGGRGPEVMHETFDELRKYTQIHFTAEQELMKEHGYEDYVEHCHEHRVFVDQMAMDRDAFDAGTKSVDQKVLPVPPQLARRPHHRHGSWLHRPLSSRRGWSSPSG